MHKNVADGVGGEITPGGTELWGSTVEANIVYKLRLKMNKSSSEIACKVSDTSLLWRLSYYTVLLCAIIQFNELP